jgi:hypothetical protein
MKTMSTNTEEDEDEGDDGHNQLIVDQGDLDDPDHDLEHHHKDLQHSLRPHGLKMPMGLSGINELNLLRGPSDIMGDAANYALHLSSLDLSAVDVRNAQDVLSHACNAIFKNGLADERDPLSALPIRHELIGRLASSLVGGFTRPSTEPTRFPMSASGTTPSFSLDRASRIHPMLRRRYQRILTRSSRANGGTGDADIICSPSQSDSAKRGARRNDKLLFENDSRHICRSKPRRR